MNRISLLSVRDAFLLFCFLTLSSQAHAGDSFDSLRESYSTARLPTSADLKLDSIWHCSSHFANGNTSIEYNRFKFVHFEDRFQNVFSREVYTPLNHSELGNPFQTTLIRVDQGSRLIAVSVSKNREIISYTVCDPNATTLIRVVAANKIFPAVEGEYPSLEGKQIIDESAIVLSPGVGIVAHYFKGILPPEKVTQWTSEFETIPKKNDQRGNAAGPLNLMMLRAGTIKRCKEKGTLVPVASKPVSEAEFANLGYLIENNETRYYRWEGTKLHILDGNFKRYNILRSTTVGYAPTGNGKLSEAAETNPTRYFDSIIPFCEEMSEYFENLTPEWYSKQKKIFDRTNLRMGKSVFSAATFNLGTPDLNNDFTDSRTANHRDENHSAQGYEVFVVLGREISGGELIFPEYGFALKLAAGDLVVMNGRRDLHGNAPLLGGKKLSVIMYVHSKHENFSGTPETCVQGETPVALEEREDKKACPFPGCTKVLSDSNHVADHIRKVHHTCRRCRLQFSNLLNLRLHLEKCWDPRNKRKNGSQKGVSSKKIKEEEVDSVPNF